MNELLKFILEHCSFLYDDLGARFVDSLTDGGNALIVLELGDLRLQFVRDRDQIFVDFQHSQRPPNKKWFSIDIVEQLLTGKVQDSAVMDGTKAEFLKSRIDDIQKAFSKEAHVASEKTLREFERARAKRLFG